MEKESSFQPSVFSVSSCSIIPTVKPTVKPTMKPTMKPSSNILRNLLIQGAMLCALALPGTIARAEESVATADKPAVTAIDILLEPDATMIEHAEAVNARLRASFPEGYALDAAHRPHISMFQCFVPTADLDKVYAAANKVLANEKVTDLKLKAFKYYYLPSENIGLSGVVVEPTPELIKLQADLIAAVKPFTKKTATVAAFFTTPEHPEIHPALISYVEVFATEHAGKHFLPHVSTGIATKEYLDKMLAEPFKDFTFAPAGAAVYQLGDYGTAAKRLTALDVKP